MFDHGGEGLSVHNNLTMRGDQYLAAFAALADN
jgi:hypothetical protein